MTVYYPFRNRTGLQDTKYPHSRPITPRSYTVRPTPTQGSRTQNHRHMSEIQALALARDFKKCDKSLRKAESTVQRYIEKGYTPDEALLLAGFGGYGIDN